MIVRLYGNSQRPHFWNVVPLTDNASKETIIRNFVDSNKKELVEKFIDQTKSFYYLLELKLDENPSVNSSEEIRKMIVPKNWIEELVLEDKKQYLYKIKKEVLELGKDSNLSDVITAYYHLIEKLQEKNIVKGSSVCYPKDMVYNPVNRKLCGHFAALRHLYQHPEINGERELNFIIKLLTSICNKDVQFLEDILKELDFINDLYLLPENLELKSAIKQKFMSEVIKKLDKKRFELKESTLPMFCDWLMTVLNANNYGGNSFMNMKRDEFEAVVSFSLEQEGIDLFIKVQGLTSYIPKIKLIPNEWKPVRIRF